MKHEHRNTPPHRITGRNAQNEDGFATICVLVLATVIFYLLTLVLSSTYDLRKENRRLADEIQRRAQAEKVVPPER